MACSVAENVSSYSLLDVWESYRGNATGFYVTAAVVGMHVMYYSDAITRMRNLVKTR